MVEVEHAGDSVEAESVEFENIEPVLDVGKEEMEYLVFVVVKAIGRFQTEA